ncbi:MAG: tRNA epoxyqueuosine(34) reductase QueG [Idiomarina sp.]|nr:tRNA epoxyqueuosine(34) reductase QueG [Idiomarina sp.]
MHAPIDYQELAEKIKQWGKELGFQGVGIADLDLSSQEAALQDWLDKQYHGDMDYMKRHGMLRARPADLHPGSVRAISVRMDYLPRNAKFAHALKQGNLAYVSRYALGRDYHKVMRKRLKQLGDKIKAYCAEADFRPFVDSAPILERPLAEKAGLGWTGKHSLLLDAKDGSWFFLGELLINLPLPVDQPQADQCGSCTACMTICPTQAIVEPYVIDARRCISYLTIEHPGVIAEEFRSAMGNRIYGCDDCQLICPWNRYATTTAEEDFTPRHELHAPELLDLWNWNEDTFLKKTEGSPIRRIGYERWQRNLAIALGNAPYSQAICDALTAARQQVSAMVLEHVDWALAEQAQRKNTMTRQQARLIRVIEKGLPRDA